MHLPPAALPICHLPCFESFDVCRFAHTGPAGPAPTGRALCHSHTLRDACSLAQSHLHACTSGPAPAVTSCQQAQHRHPQTPCHPHARTAVTALAATVTALAAAVTCSPDHFCQVSSVCPRSLDLREQTATLPPWAMEQRCWVLARTSGERIT